jgi:cytochrome P450
MSFNLTLTSISSLLTMTLLSDSASSSGPNHGPGSSASSSSVSLFAGSGPSNTIIIPSLSLSLSYIISFIVIILSTLVLYYIWYLPRWWMCYWKSQGIPVYDYRFLVGETKHMSEFCDKSDNGMAFQMKASHDKGNVYGICYGPVSILQVDDPDLLRDMSKNSQCYHKSNEFFKRSLRPLLGNGLLMSDGHTWKSQRKMVAPAFHHKAMKQSIDIIVAATKSFMDKWMHQVDSGHRSGCGSHSHCESKCNGGSGVGPGASAAASAAASTHDTEPEPGTIQVDIMHDLSKLTLDIIATAAFGPTFLSDPKVHATVHEAFATTLQDLQDRAASMISLLPIIRNLPIANKQRAEDGCAKIDKIVRDVIRDRRAKLNTPLNGGRDLLDCLVDCGNGVSYDSDGHETKLEHSMSDELVLDEAKTFVFAAYETTANAFAWTFILFARHPDVMEKCIQEVDEVLGTGSSSRTPVYDDLRRLKYIDATLKESLRLYPPFPCVSKYCVTEHQIGGSSLRDDQDDHKKNQKKKITVPAGAIISTNAYVVHRNPKYWPNPNKFDPQRWLTPEPKQYRHAYKYLAFSSGSRSCLGKRFALLEGKIIMSMLLQRFRVDLMPGQKLKGIFHKLNYVPASQVFMKLTKRTDNA